MKNNIRKIIKRHTNAWRQSAGLLLILLFMAPYEAHAISRIDIHGGSLFVGASLSVGELHVDAGATLGGTGSIIGDLTVEGSITPSVQVPSPASLYVYGDVVFVAGSSFHCHAASHTQCDGLTVNGTLSGTCVVVPTKASGAVPVDKIVCGLKFGTFSGFSLSPADEGNWRLETSGGVLYLTDLVGDSDSNSLPDWFELEYFFVRTGTDPDGHGDDDGMTNQEEWIAGTDPTDGSASFKMGPIVRHPPADDGIALGFYIEWPSVAGRHYELYYGSAVDSRVNVMHSHAASPPTNIFYFKTGLDTMFVHGTVERSP